MVKGKAELKNSEGHIFAAFNETCHPHGTSVTVKLRAPFKLTGTELLALYAKGIAQPVLTVEASDPDGTEIHEFHGTSAVGCVAVGTGLSLVQSPGGNLGTLLIVLATGTVNS